MSEWVKLLCYGVVMCGFAFTLPIMAGAIAEHTLSNPQPTFIGGIVK